MYSWQCDSVDVVAQPADMFGVLLNPTVAMQFWCPPCEWAAKQWRLAKEKATKIAEAARQAAESVWKKTKQLAAVSRYSD